MIRGTTPTISFKLPFDYNLVEEIWLTLEQRGKEVLTKTKEDMVYEWNIVSTKLTQEETLMFREKEQVKIQARIRTVDGNVFASKIRTITVDEILKDGVI